MKSERQPKISMTPVMDNICQPHTYVDNELQDSARELSLWRAFKRHGVAKRSGWGGAPLLFAILMWPFFRVRAVSSFCGKYLSAFVRCGKDAVYDFQKREDVNWAAMSRAVSVEMYRRHDLQDLDDSAFVVDDTFKNRSGKKMEGCSSHFDHTEGRCAMGQQTLVLGHVSEKGFVPLEEQIFVGEKNVRVPDKSFEDGRSAVAKDYLRATTMTKNEMLETMLRQAVRSGIKAKFLLGDAWFGNKGNISLALELGLVAILRMKRGTLKYRFKGKLYTAYELYTIFERELKPLKGGEWKTHSLVVEINLSESPKEEPRWVKVKLLFSAPINPRKDEWALFLCTDVAMKDSEILRIYALRWGVEVYFKETKQHLGFLAEQTGNYACHYASIHLTAIRFMLLLNSMLERNGAYFGEIRSEVSGQLETITFAGLLWTLFKALIYGALDHFEKMLGAERLQEIKDKIHDTVVDFLRKALQLDAFSLESEAKAEKLGYLT